MGKLPHNPEKDKFYFTIGRNIQNFRKYAGITQEDLAFLMSISRVSVNNIENGKQRLPLHCIGQLCTIFKCSYNDIIPDYNGGVKQLQELYEERTILVKKK